MPFPYKKTERALRAYHGNEQEKPVGELGSIEQAGGRRGAPSDEQSRSEEIDVGHSGRWGCHKKLSGKMATCMTKCMSY